MPATGWTEIVAPDEATRFARYADILSEIQRRRADGAPPSRALHAKANLGVLGTLDVPADVPADAKIGMFATAGSYRALVRYSNGAARHQPDRKPDVRGFAVKLLGVGGKKLIPGMEDATTQDLLAIRTPSVPMRDADEFIRLVRAAQTPALLPLKLLAGLGVRRGLALLRGALVGLRMPTAPLAATAFYSALPITYGPYAVQFAFVPRDLVARSTAADLGAELSARLRTAPVVYDLRIRFFQDAVATPIEDASVAWTSPLVTIATLTLPAQDTTSPRGQRIGEYIETLAFDPWHARTDLRPLGNIMRARNVAYRASTQARHAAGEPTELPALADE